MPAERAPMGKVREVLRLRHALGVTELVPPQDRSAICLGRCFSPIAKERKSYA